MIIKNFEIRKTKLENFNFFLLYGSNQGFKKQVIKELFTANFNGEIIRFDESEILKNTEGFIEELFNESLFNEKKIILISRCTDKISEIIDEISKKNLNTKIILNSDNLDKKSKLRVLFEKKKELICIPFYEDNNQTLFQICVSFFRNENIKVSSEIISLLVERSKGDRLNIQMELNKIKNLSISRDRINVDDILELTNLSENYSVFELVENYLTKDKKKISKILNENNYNNDDCILIVRTVINRSKRLAKLIEEYEKTSNLELVIKSYKPPIFWKEKEIVSKQIKSWSLKEIKNKIYETSNLEKLIKKNSINSVNFISDFICNY